MPGPRSATRATSGLSLYDRHVTRNSGYRSGPAKGKAIVTVAHAILVIISLARPDHRAPYDDLGPDYLDQRADPEREARRLIASLEALGKHVTLHDAA